MIPKKPVQMAREIHASASNEINFQEARRSIEESMNRLFPTHSYSSEDVHYQGKLIVINYTYEYSRWRHLKIVCQNAWRRWRGKQEQPLAQ